MKISACGVCRMDFQVVDGELPDPKVPIIPGHGIVERIDSIGTGAEGLRMGERAGIPWLGHTCGGCPYCIGEQENLCDHPLFTGYTRNGGFATMPTASRCSMKAASSPSERLTRSNTARTRACSSFCMPALAKDWWLPPVCHRLFPPRKSMTGGCAEVEIGCFKIYETQRHRPG